MQQTMGPIGPRHIWRHDDVQPENNRAIARSKWDAPEIDGLLREAVFLRLRVRGVLCERRSGARTRASSEA